MNIITTRRIAQIFFFALFLWFCIVTALGDHWFQLRGWPVNWFLELDPLVALGTLLATKTLYAGLIWALLTVALTIFLGRFFCGWVCPFGALHQFIGWLGRRRRKHGERVAMNQYRSPQAIKYYILLAMLGAAGGGLLGELARAPRQHALVTVALGFLIAATTGFVIRRKKNSGKALGAILFLAVPIRTRFRYAIGHARFVAPDRFARSHSADAPLRQSRGAYRF